MDKKHARNTLTTLTSGLWGLLIPGILLLLWYLATTRGAVPEYVETLERNY